MLALLTDLASLTLKFSRVDRATRHEDGIRPETDSDHTVMLGIVCCAYASRVAPQLDLGKISQYAMVHDFVEAYSGDVVSLGLSADARQVKEANEAAALLRIEREFADLPWVSRTIREYESLADEESRFVKIVDKCLPKLTHLLNNGAALRAIGVSYDKAHRDHLTQRSMMAAKYPQTEALQLFDAVVSACARTWGLTT